MSLDTETNKIYFIKSLLLIIVHKLTGNGDCFFENGGYVLHGQKENPDIWK